MGHFHTIVFPAGDEPADHSVEITKEDDILIVLQEPVVLSSGASRKILFKKNLPLVPRSPGEAARLALLEHRQRIEELRENLETLERRSRALEDFARRHEQAVPVEPPPPSEDTEPPAP